MKSINKALFMAMAMTLAGLLASCNDDGSWTAGKITDLAYTFQSTSISASYGPYDTVEDVEVTVTRNTTSGDVTLAVAAQFSDETLITGPQYVEFSDGNNTAVYTITVVRDFEIGENATATLTIADSIIGLTPAVEYPDSALLAKGTAADSTAFYTQQTAYNTAYNTYVAQLSAYKLSTTVSINKDYSWTSLGTGTYTDAAWWLDDNNSTTSVEIFQCDQNPLLFQMPNPYNWIDDADEYLQFYLLQPGDVVGSTTVTRSDLVRFYDCCIDYSSSYSNYVYILWPGRFTSYATEDSWSLNYVKSWQDDGLPAVIQLAPYYYMFGTGGWNYTVYDDIITIVFPGVKISDYSASISYTGSYINTDDAMYAQVETELGSDVDYARIAIVAGEDNIEDAYYGILAGTLEYTEITAGGEYSIPIPEDLTTGYATIAILTFDNEGGVQEYDYDTFLYRARTEFADWDITQTLIGDYNYNALFGGSDPDLTLTNDGNGTYTIAHWGYDVDFKFSMDDDGNIDVPAQYTGYDHSTYGSVYVSDYATYEGVYYANYYYGDADDETWQEAYEYYHDYFAESYPSYYDAISGTFKFCVIYYVSAGYFGYDYETFTVTGYADAATSASASANKALKLNTKAKSDALQIQVPKVSADVLAASVKPSTTAVSASSVLLVSNPKFKQLPIVSESNVSKTMNSRVVMKSAPEQISGYLIR